MITSTGNVPVSDVQPGDWFVVDTGNPWVTTGETIIEGLRRRRRRWTHAGIAVRRQDGELYTVEATPAGATLMPWTWGARPHMWSTGTRYSGGHKAAGRALRYAAPGSWGKAGVPYSWLDYAAIALHAAGLSTRWVRGRIESTHEQICSQLVDRCCQEAGVQLFDDGRWPGFVTPDDLGLLLVPDDGLAVASKDEVA